MKEAAKMRNSPEFQAAMKKMQKSPQLLKERMLTIEEFYRQTPENVNPGRSSRLLRNFI